MLNGGRNLRLLRKQLGLTMQDIETASTTIASRYNNNEFLIPPSRLSDIETKGILPSIHRFYSLAVIYRKDVRELLSLYGVDLNGIAKDIEVSIPTKSHFFGALGNVSAITMPIRLDPGFDTRRTTNFSRMVETWGVVPLSYLEQFASREYTYGYIGSEDLTMYPILPPGTFLQVDESRNEVANGGWRSEYERPIYFVETRTSHVCCWCTLDGDEIILQPHPLSPVTAKIFKYPQEAEVIGQVVGVAMRLGEWHVNSQLESEAQPSGEHNVAVPSRQKAS
ncbi:MAG TPA: helix-turn-helix transcriptional regulator [Terriglobales bacterium]|nr:helix-turn-helix transcriptional regulator [Terriglobales bacterium]